MPQYEPGLTFDPSPESIELLRRRLEHWGFSISESSASSLVEEVLAIEVPRMQAIARGILHGSLETIRQTAEVALRTLRENSAEMPDLVGAVKERVSAGPRLSHRPPQAADVDDDEPRPVFKRRGR
jgi:hypothetical protein